MNINRFTEKMKESVITREPVNSSNIASLGYDETTRTMEAEFYGRRNQPNKVFRYHPITPDGYKELFNAESIGSYFNTHIKNNPNVWFVEVTPSQS